MEPVFENRYYSNHKMMAEFGRKYSVGPRMPMVIGFWVLYIFVMVPVLLIPENFDGSLRVMLWVLGPVMLVTTFLPQLYAWSAIRNSRKQNDGVLPETVITFGETIELHEGMVRITVEYRKIQRVVRLKHSYMLMLGKRNGVMLSPDGFSKGTFDEFKAFLREKRPDLNIPE